MKIIEVSRGLPSRKYPMNGIFEWDQAKALKSEGNEVIFIAIDLRSIRRWRKFGLFKTEIDDIEIYNYNIPIGRVPNFIIQFVFWKAYKKIINKICQNDGGKIDIIHFHFGRTVLTNAIKSKNKYGIPYIVTEHDSTVNNNKINDNIRKKLKKLYSNSLANIAVSKSFKLKLESIYNEKFYYIPNIVDLRSIYCINKMPHENFTFITVGNLLKNKCMHNLIEAFYYIYKKNHNFILYIIGDGPEKNNLNNLIKSKKMTNNVFLIGRIERKEIKSYFDKSDCFVLLSKSETFGLSYIEAMAAGLPIIATKCGGPENFVTADNGLLVDVDNIQQAVDAMNHMIAHIQEYDAVKIRQYCLDNFSPSVVAKQIMELIKL